MPVNASVRVESTVRDAGFIAQSAGQTSYLIPFRSFPDGEPLVISFCSCDFETASFGASYQSATAKNCAGETVTGEQVVPSKFPIHQRDGGAQQTDGGCLNPCVPPSIWGRAQDGGPSPDAGNADASLSEDGGRFDGGSGDGGATCSPAPDGGGCFTLGPFGDCPTRCPCGVVASTSGCLACACGLTGSEDHSAGCAGDGDCQLARADCCGCTSGGVSTAILRSSAATWEQAVSSHCGGVGWDGGGCPTVDVCGSAQALCRGGRCVVVQ